MSRRLDVINLGDPEQRPAPKMMSSCETGGCAGGPEPQIPPPPTFGEVRVNGVEITPEAIAQVKATSENAIGYADARSHAGARQSERGRE